MTGILKRLLTVTALATWGAVLATMFFSGRIESYLHPAFRVGTGVSGVILLLIAGILLLTTEEGGDDHSSCDDHDHEHASSLFGNLVRLSILIVPILGAFFISPSQFSATLVRNRGMIDSIHELPGYTPGTAAFVEPALPTPEGPGEEAGEEVYSAIDFLPRDAEGRIEAQIIDLLYAAEEPPIRADFENQELVLTGQFLPADTRNPDGNRFNLVRFMILCCAADARPVNVLVEGPWPDDLQEMEWVRVEGHATFPVEGGRSSALFHASSIERTEPPQESFLY